MDVQRLHTAVWGSSKCYKSYQHTCWLLSDWQPHTGTPLAQKLTVWLILWRILPPGIEPQKTGFNIFAKKKCHLPKMSLKRLIPWLFRTPPPHDRKRNYFTREFCNRWAGEKKLEKKNIPKGQENIYTYASYSSDPLHKLICTYFFAGTCNEERQLIL